ncbi:hypothetical protein [Aquimarina pacifica]|uniref:hypothetical protein n=1 Tax=Aquimarina pacifica TaxID=1296415 RepID=UPI000471DE99|nr:hypothetical protein [Aquimarina pacifica]
MNYFKKILEYIGWLMIHLLFGLILAFIGIEFVFSHISIFSSFFEEHIGVHRFFQELAILMISLFGAGIAFLFFIPLHIYQIKPKFKIKKNRFLSSVFTSFILVITSGLFNLFFYYLDKKNIVDFSFLFVF